MDKDIVPPLTYQMLVLRKLNMYYLFKMPLRFKVTRPDGRKVELKHNVGSLNRIDRLTAANYSLPINQNSCENMTIAIDEQQIMLQAVSIFTKAEEWTAKEMLSIMMDIARTSLEIIGLIEKEERNTK